MGDVDQPPVLRNQQKKVKFYLPEANREPDYEHGGLLNAEGWGPCLLGAGCTFWLGTRV